ncbi:chemotaxis protein CheW [Halorubellus sp. JP-L1]|uniref:chemotaxis protein CheW n=1 Tax=Halorubellus sp. JP-L1 TaxID=2715753 RepID=UPI001407B349|nr:chemotaxis protein CheW [Halorubellus sp. JP-L1]NHN40098.1 chemotaxis protein CheW [Halorubellus sp. JP-L1]
MSADLPDELQDVEVSSPSDDETRESDTDRGDGDGDPDEFEDFVVFAVGDRRLAVSVDAVRNIVTVGATTRVPRAASAIDGIMDLRGEITAIIDARSHFPTRAAEPATSDQRIIVFDMPQGRQSAGIRVDAVEGVELFPLKYVTPSETVDDEAADHPLVAALLHRVENGEKTDPVGLVDVEGIVEASGPVGQSDDAPSNVS